MKYIILICTLLFVGCEGASKYPCGTKILIDGKYEGVVLYYAGSKDGDTTYVTYIDGIGVSHRECIHNNFITLKEE